MSLGQSAQAEPGGDHGDGLIGIMRQDFFVGGLGFLKKLRAVAVGAEGAYSEGEGDITFPATMRHSARYPADLAALDRVAGKGVPVVTILLSGRTVSANDLINRSDAFIAAWLPGTEAQGISDLLFARRNGPPAYDFSGTLSFDWPAGDCLRPGESQFRRGYGLSYRRPARVGRLPVGPAIANCPPDSQ